MARFIGPVIVWTLLLTAATTASATPILQRIAPPTDFTFGGDPGDDFFPMTGSGVGDVTASLWAVDLDIPSPGGSTSGCEAADFAGFTAGNIALIQRGTCTFAMKVANAQSAGAVGVLIFNEGNTPDRLPVLVGTLGGFLADVPVFGTSFAVGDALRNGFLLGPTGVLVRMAVTEEDLEAIAVPEPGMIALFGLGMAGLARSRRLRRPR